MQFTNFTKAIATLSLLGLTAPLFAEDDDEMRQAPYYSPTLYDSVESIPSVLVADLRPNVFLEDFISNKLKIIRINSETKNILDGASLKGIKDKLINKGRSKQRSQMVGYDVNQNTFITQQEVMDSVHERFARYNEAQTQATIKRELAKVMALDHDSDGKVSYKEMSTLSAKAMDYIKNNSTIKYVAQYIALDPNEDGALSSQELMMLAQKAFATVDTDGDTIISQIEYAALKRVQDVIRAKEQAERRRITREQRAKSQPSRRTNKRDVCTFPNLKLPDEFTVYAASIHSGRKLWIQIDKSSDGSRIVDVVVNDTKSPVALILSAHRPTIWKIQKTKNTKIAAVTATGTHRQVITGLDESIPILSNTRDRDGNCDSFGYLDTRKLSKFNKLSQALYKRDVSMYYPATKKSAVVLGEKEYDKDSLMEYTGPDPESFRIVNTLFAGQKGLDEAEKLGLIRKANKQDFSALEKNFKKFVEYNPNPNDPPISQVDVAEETGDNIYYKRGYVVLKDFTFPAGMSDKILRTFIVYSKEAHPKVTGNPGHSRLYDYHTMKCKGIVCDGDRASTHAFIGNSVIINKRNPRP